MLTSNLRTIFMLVIGAGIVGCSAQVTQYSPVIAQAKRLPSSTSPIKHVILVIQENRSFDNLFATFPGANGTTTGRLAAVPPSLQSQCPYPYATSIPLKESHLYVGNDYEHRYETAKPTRPGGFLVDLDGGRMDGFDLSYIPAGSKIDCTGPYQYVDPSEIPEYWTLASQYVLADNMFQTQGSSSFTAHQDLIAGGTVINHPVGSYYSDSVIDNPTWFPWGCEAKDSEVTSLITTDLTYLNDDGPRPCYTQYQTLRDLLDKAHVSWKFYAEKITIPSQKNHEKTGAGIWSAFDAISAVRYSKEWGTKVVWPDTKLFHDIHTGRLPAMSWVTPDAPNSDHPQTSCKCDKGPAWVAQIANAVGNSKYWNSSAIIVVWDDWGGFYDHVPPPTLTPPDNQGGLGFRVPMLIISPYVQAHVEHTQYEFGSILKFIEENWNLGSLGTTDVRATSIGNAFDYGQRRRAFIEIPTEYSERYFLSQRPSNEVPDRE